MNISRELSSNFQLNLCLFVNCVPLNQIHLIHSKFYLFFLSSESSSYNASDSVAMCRKDSWSEEAFLLCLKSLKVIDESFLCGQENVE